MKLGIQFTNAAIILTELLKRSKNVQDEQSIKILGKNYASDSRINFTDYQFVIKGVLTIQNTKCVMAKSIKKNKKHYST